MANVPKKVADRLTQVVPRFQRVIKVALDRDVNEADTVLIIQDIVAEVFGFDKYVEITSEFAIRGTYCDLAIKVEDKVQYLIEVKAIGLSLKDAHLKQVIDYGANRGVPWVILTNGVHWQLHRIKFERPIGHELVASFEFLELNARNSEDKELLYLLTKEGLSKSVRDTYYDRVQSVNRFVLGAILTSPVILRILRREVKKLSGGIKVEQSEVEKILREEVLKRQVLEGEEAEKATAKVKKSSKKTSHKSIKHGTASTPTEPSGA
jgi:predicted type IV restriction endonuclease